MADVFHLGLEQADLRGATVAIIPGDPGRVERIASELDEPRALASTREYTSFAGALDDRPVVVCSTGIGGPSTSIAVEELGQLGVRTFLRVGTTGAIQPGIEVGSMIISQGSVRLDGASTHFAPIEYPAVSSYECTSALVSAAERAGAQFRVGITVSSDTFYPGQERYDTVSGHVTAALRGSLTEWQALNALNYEMESATLFTMCSALGFRAGCVAGVIVNRNDQEIPDEAAMAATESLAVQIVVDSIRDL